MVFNSLVYEFVNFVWYFFGLVEQSLLLIILPVKSQVLHANSLPKIAQLSPCRVYNSSDFVCNYEF
jgi:hypothetical protein